MTSSSKVVLGARCTDRIAAIDYAIGRPAEVDVNEIVVRPTAQG